MLQDYNKNRPGHLGKQVNLDKQVNITIDADFIYNCILKH